MGIADVILLGIAGLWLAAALYALRRKRKGRPGGCANCPGGCSAACGSGGCARRGG